MLIDYIVGIGLDAVKDKIHDGAEEQILRDRLKSYIERQAKINFHCTLEEEIDFGGLSNYIQNDLITDVQSCLFGDKKERGMARKIIMDKSVSYSQAHTSLSCKRAMQLVGMAINILRGFYKSKVNRELKFIAAQIEDTAVEITTAQTEEIVHTVKSSEQRIIESVSEKIENNEKMSLEKSMRLMRKGDIGQVESVLENFKDAIQSTHILFPDYGYELQREKCQFYSKALTQEALEKYPPRISCTGTIQIKGKYIDNFDVNTINYANRHQLPITLNVITAKKYLGDIYDPVQHEAEDLIGESIIIEPTPFPAFPCSISLDGKVFFDYILFRTEEIFDDGTVIISNSEQMNCSYRIKMTANPHSHKTTYTISTVEPTNEELLQLFKFLKQASLGAMISIKVLSVGEELAHGKSGVLDYETGFNTLDDEIDFLEKIVAIEQYFKCPISIPKEIMMEDFRTISYVAALIQGEECTGSWSKLEFSMPLTEDLQQKLIESDNSKFSLTYVDSISADIFGRKFDLSAIRRFDSVIYENLERLKQKATVLEVGDDIKIRFLPGEGENGKWCDSLNNESINE